MRPITPTHLIGPLTRNESIALLFLLALAATWALLDPPPGTPAESARTATVIRIEL